MNRLSLKKISIFFCFILFFTECGNAQSESRKKNRQQAPISSDKAIQEFRVMFYNVENLFDTYDDPTKLDNDFLPNGSMRWTNNRYYRALRKTAQVISSIGEWGAPALCGLCEVENDTVLTHLLNRTPLKEQLYNYCITTGNDARGINNALIYKRDKFKYLGHASRRIEFTNKNKRSRDILHVWGEVMNGERLDVFVCHFPSRSGGEKESEQDRIDAARYLRSLCDSLYRDNPLCNMLIMGDFNDNPSDKSIQTLLKGSNLVHLFDNPKVLNYLGSHKFQGEWSQLDQMMASAHWNSYLKAGSARIFAADFLLSKKDSRGEQSPLRKYAGPVYKGGFSDHLPVVVDFFIPLEAHE